MQFYKSLCLYSLALLWACSQEKKLSDKTTTDSKVTSGPTESAVTPVVTTAQTSNTKTATDSGTGAVLSTSSSTSDGTSSSTSDGTSSSTSGITEISTDTSTSTETIADTFTSATETELTHPTPYSIAIEMNNEQSVAAGTSSLPFVVIVKDANTDPVSGVTVNWSVSSGGGTLSSSSSLTAADGTASSTLTLGVSLGLNTVTATIISGTPDTVTFTATGIIGSPAKLIFSQQPVSTLASSAMSSVIVAVTDANNNIITSATNSITLSIGNNPNSASLSGTLTKAAISGTASFTDLALDKLGASYTLLAAASGLTSGASSAFNIKANLSLVGPESPLSSACALYTLNLRDSLGNLVTAPENTNITLDSNSYFVNSSDTNHCSNTLGTQITTTTIASGDFAKSFYLRPENQNNIQLEFSSSAAWLNASPIFSSAITVNTSPGSAGSFDLGGHSNSSGSTAANFKNYNDYPASVAIQTDGKIILGGYSDSGSDHDFALARFNTDGSLDITFGTGGRTTVEFSESNENDEINAIILQADGKIIAVGRSYNGSDDDFALARFNTDGSLDSSFGTDGKVSTDFAGGNDSANAITLQSDGKLIVAGRSYNGSNNDFALARYSADGSLDNTFGSSGKVSTNFAGDEDIAYAAVLQADGKIILAGASFDGTSDSFALARYSSSGSLDNTFGSSGKVITSFAGEPSNAFAAALQNDGKVILSGAAFNGSDSDFAMVRYNTDGSLDSVFGSSGKVVSDFSGNIDSASAMVIESDGKIILAGLSTGSNQNFALVRYNDDGSLDSAFGTSGKIISNIVGEARAVALQADEKIVLAGYSNGDFALARYTTSGSLDSAFGGFEPLISGYFVSNEASGVNAVATQSDGKTLLASFSSSVSSEDFRLLRYNEDGTLDSGFGTGGKVATDFSGFRDSANAIKLQPDGKVVLAGSSNNGANNDFALARYDSNGTLDSTFGSSGKKTITIGTGNEEAKGVALQTDGKIVLAGFSNNGSNDDFALVRLNKDGSLDSTFASGGKAISDFANSSDRASALAIQTDGKIILAGFSSSDFALVRYNTDGSLDSTFGSSGKVTSDFAGGLDGINAISLQVDGKIIVGGYSYNGFRSDFALARYNTDGSLDATFGSGGKVTTDYTGYNDEAVALGVQADGKIVVTGSSYNGWNSDVVLARYNINGSLDSNFGTGGKVTGNFYSYSYGAGMSIQEDGKIVVGGSWRGYFMLLRLWL